jgi:hypothetical protein
MHPERTPGAFGRLDVRGLSVELGASSVTDLPFAWGTFDAAWCSGEPRTLTWERTAPLSTEESAYLHGAVSWLGDEDARHWLGDDRRPLPGAAGPRRRGLCAPAQRPARRADHQRGDHHRLMHPSARVAVGLVSFMRTC